jgi:hypothetical protein
MPAAALVDVDVHQRWHADGVERPGELHVEPRLLPTLPQRGIPRRLARIEMPTGLQPDAEPLVLEQHHAARAHHDARTGHVDRIGVLVERHRQRIEQLQESLDRNPLAVVDRPARHHLGPNPPPEVVTEIITVHHTGVPGTARITSVWFLVEFLLSSSGSCRYLTQTHQRQPPPRWNGGTSPWTTTSTSHLAS